MVISEEQQAEMAKIISAELEKFYRNGFKDGIDIVMDCIGHTLTSEQVDEANRRLEEKLAVREAKAA